MYSSEWLYVLMAYAVSVVWFAMFAGFVGETDVELFRFRRKAAPFTRVATYVLMGLLWFVIVPYIVVRFIRNVLLR